MLPPDSRAVLIEALRPPVGYVLDAAVATTFTLDLTAAVIPPLAFSSFAASSHLSDPVAVLESIRSAADRVDIFCQAGNISIPSRAPDLIAFVEPMVHAVKRPPGHLFHPKIWFVRFIDDAQAPAYRLLVLTRNLTSDRAWDIVVRLDSATVSRRQLPANVDLRDLLISLPERAVSPLATARRQRIEKLAYAAQYVEWERPEGVDRLTLHYLGGKKQRVLDFTGRRHLVVSPFLDDAALDSIAPRTQSLTVVSRPESLERLSPDQLARTIAYRVDSMAGVTTEEEVASTQSASGEPPADAAPPSPLSGLHAKLIVVEPFGRAERAKVFIGSANATSAALNGNVEFLVELEGKRRLFGVDAFLGEEGSFGSLIEQYDASGRAAKEPDEDERWELENRLRTIAEIRHTLTVEPADGPTALARDSHDLHLGTDRAYPIGDGWSATIELLTRPGVALSAEPSLALDARFAAVPTADISPFVAVRMTSPAGLQGGTVLLASLVGDPADRLDLVLARQIDTPEKFLRFLHLILSLGNPHLLAQLSGAAGDRSGRGIRMGSTGILELVLRALSEKPEALTDLGRLVSRLSATLKGRELLPDGFDALWKEVELARQHLRGTTL